MAEGILVNPPSYLTAAQFLAATPASEFDPTTLTTAQLQLALNAASGAANAIMKRNLLATERTEVFYGDGSDVLDLGTFPIIYVRQMQFVQPGISGFIIPTNRILVDALKGQVVQYSPLELQGVGFVSVFPAGLPIAITFAKGYGFNPVTPPQFTATDAPTVVGGIPVGWYTVGVTTATQWGESLPSLRSVETISGTISCLVDPVLGAWKYRVFLAPGAMSTLADPVEVGATTLVLNPAAGMAFEPGTSIVIDPSGAADPVTIIAVSGNGLILTITPTASAHAAQALVAPQATLVSEIPATTFGDQQTGGAIAYMTPPAGYYAEPAPIVDSSQLPLPNEIFEAVRLLTLDRIYRGGLFALRGLVGDQKIKYAAPVAKDGTSLLYTQAAALLVPQKLSSLF